jgi:hemolysin-activating ACP:hemolysin acyltransferase
MRRNFLHVFDQPSAAAKAQVVNIGFIARLLTASPYHARFGLSEHLAQVVAPALQHRQCRIFFNQRGDPVAYVIWATLAPEVEAEFLRTGAWRLHISEWNEDGMPWVIDLCAPFGHFGFVVRALLETTFAEFTHCRYAHYKRNTMVVREVDRASVQRLLARRLHGHDAC